jgi:S1-C subfamily serine protease
MDPRRRSALYSSAAQGPTSRPAGAAASPVQPGSAASPAAGAGGSAAAAAAAAPVVATSWRTRLRRQAQPIALGLCVTLVVVLLARDLLRPAPRSLTQKVIDDAVLHTLQTKPLPSRAAQAAEAVMPAVVRVRGWMTDIDNPGGNDAERGTGSGVLIVAEGLILTNFHVVAGMDRLTVTFFDGSESEARVMRTFADKDLAVLRVQKVPDDAEPATMGSSGELRPGDEVVAVGFPFGIGPSVSAGVVSGLDREFRSSEGKPPLTGMIQFDAAANPGNSGGPLVTMNGEVVGIVTAILNPTPARTFIGIGFATTIESAGSSVGIPPF